MTGAPRTQTEKDVKPVASIKKASGTRIRGGRRRVVTKGAAVASARRPDIYRVRVTVIDLLRRPVDDAKVWSTFGGEAKKVAGGWQFDIPAAGNPVKGEVTFFALKESAFLRGEQKLQLDKEPNPAITIELKRQVEGITVRGIILDSSGTAVNGARVSVVGYEGEAVVTRSHGGFVLPAHVADGQQVYLHVEKDGYKSVSRWHPAGSEPAIIVLEKE